MGFKDKRNNSNNNQEKHEHNNQKENNQHTDSLKKDDKDIFDEKDIGTRKEILENKIKNLEEIHKNDLQKIQALENQLFDFNNSYKSEIIKKADEAQQILNNKIKEFQLKSEIETKNIKKYALKDNIVNLLNIISDFENVLIHKPNNEIIVNYLKGFEMFLSMFKNYLSEIGIKEINVKVNDDFDHNKMSPIDTEQNPNFKPNKIIKIVKKGYYLHDLVVLPTTVIVSK